MKKIEVISPLWDNPIIEIQFGTIAEFKSKIDAFETLFGCSPKVSFMMIDEYAFQSAYYDNIYDTMSFGHASYFQIEGCKSFEITNKYFVFDNGKKYRIKPTMVASTWLYK